MVVAAERLAQMALVSASSGLKADAGDEMGVRMNRRRCCVARRVMRRDA
jgi:hypothetical protein